MERELLERLLLGNDEASVAALAALRCGGSHVVWEGTTPAEPLALIYRRRLRHTRRRGIETTNLARAVELFGRQQQPVRLGGDQSCRWLLDVQAVSDRRRQQADRVHRRAADPRLNLSRRKSATTAGPSNDQARVCPAVPPPGLATLLMPSTRASRGGRRVTTAVCPQLGKPGPRPAAASAHRRLALGTAERRHQDQEVPAHARSAGALCRGPLAAVRRSGMGSARCRGCLGGTRPRLLLGRG